MTRCACCKPWILEAVFTQERTPGRVLDWRYQPGTLLPGCFWCRGFTFSRNISTHGSRAIAIAGTGNFARMALALSMSRNLRLSKTHGGNKASGIGLQRREADQRAGISSFSPILTRRLG